MKTKNMKMKPLDIFLLVGPFLSNVEAESYRLQHGIRAAEAEVIRQESIGGSDRDRETMNALRKEIALLRATLSKK